MQQTPSYFHPVAAPYTKGHWVVHNDELRNGRYGHAHTPPNENMRQPYYYRDQRFEPPYYKPHTVNKPIARRFEKPVMELVPDFRTGILTPPKQYPVRMQRPGEYRPQLVKPGGEIVHGVHSDYRRSEVPIEPVMAKLHPTKPSVKRKKSKKTKYRSKKDPVFINDNAKSFYEPKPQPAPLPHAETITEADTNWRRTFEKFDSWIKTRLEALDNSLASE